MKILLKNTKSLKNKQFNIFFKKIKNEKLFKKMKSYKIATTNNLVKMIINFPIYRMKTL